MFDFYEKRRIKSILYSKPVCGVLLILIALLSVSVYHRFLKEREVASKQAESASNLEALQVHATELEERVSRLRSDQGMESEIREQYNVAKKGEKIVVLVDGTHDEASEEEILEVDTAEESFWQKLIFWR